MRIKELQVCLDTPLLTYATRGLEPYRGFPEFVQASCELLKKNKYWHIAIAGDDSINYYKSPKAPKNGYGHEAYQLYKSHDLLSRVHFLGSLPLLAYRDLLRRSNLHCYFTRPYVLSWSFIESMFTGCKLFASNTPPVMEFAEKDSNTCLVDYVQSDLGNSLIGHISQLEVTDASLSNNTLSDYRKDLIDKLSANTCVQRHFELAESVN